jgi:hypothetical protein
VVQHDDRLGQRLYVHHQVAERGPGRFLTADRDDGGAGGDRLGRDGDDRRLPDGRERPGTDPVGRDETTADAGVAAFGNFDRYLGSRIRFHGDLALGQGLVGMQAAEAAQRGEPPLLLAAGRDREISQVIGPVLVQPGDWGR